MTAPHLQGTGIWSSELRQGDRAEIAEGAAELEELGYTALWIPGAAGGRVFEAVRRLLEATSRVVVATGITNVWAHTPEEVAAAHAELAAAFPGRFMLGLGISHKKMVDGLELGDYRKPLSTMRAYLDAIDAAETPVPADERCLAALRPKMRALAAERTAGTHSYFVVPAHTRAARESMGPDALVAPEQTVVLETDPQRAREIARRFAATYLDLPNYTNNLLEYGYTEADIRDGGSDRLIDDVIAWGSPQQIRERVQAHVEAGADHVCLQVVQPDADPRSLGKGERMALPRALWRELAPVVTA